MADETLLSVNLQRATVAIAKADVAAGRDPDKPATWRDIARTTFKATSVASRVTALTVMWASALVDLERDHLHAEEYVAWAGESRATVYRHLAEFRELWPEYDTPNDLARLVRDHAPDRKPHMATAALA